MIHVIATIELVDGKRKAFLAEFRSIVPVVQAEAGCLEYGATIEVVTDISTQAPIRPNVVTIVEKWESVAALKAHLVAPHMVAYRPKVKEFVLSSKLQILEPA